MNDEVWVRDKLFAHAAELGAQSARQNATDAAIARIAEEMKTGFEVQRRMISDSMQSIQTGITREMAHMRGEISRLDDAYRQQREADERDHARRAAEEKRRTEELIVNLRETAERSEAAAAKVKQINRRIIFVVVLIGALASTFIENAPSLFNFIMRVFDGVS